MGLVAHMGAYTWITHTLEKFAYLPLPLAILGYFLLCLAQSTLFGAWALLLHWLVHRRGAPLVLAAPVTMTAIEWLYPALFPSYLANSQYQQVTIIQTLALWGPLGLSFLMALCAAVLHGGLDWLVRHERRAPLPAAVACA